MSEARLRGWKSIATHLGVTQSTALRWTRDPDFPVLRSGSGGSVYADPIDLDRWLARREAADPEEPIGAPSPDEPAAEPTAAPPATAPVLKHDRRDRRIWLVAGLVALVACLALGGMLLRQHESAAAGTPPPEAAQPLLDARQEMATRTPASLARAIADFQAIILRFPDLPAGFTGLADSYLLSCEFASMPRDRGYPAARAAVRTALALAPADPDAHRIMGFLRYWTDRDIDRAIPDFEAAVAGERPSYLALMWYGNALIDAGRIDQGVAQLDRALAVAPDSPAVITNHAIARWQAGDEAGALNRLDEVGRRFPQHSAAPGLSALFHLSRGEVKPYLRDTERWAALVGNPALTERIARERAAETAGGDGAALRTLADAAPIATSYWHGGLLPSAIAASLLGDRDHLIAILRSPRIPSENWRPLRFPTRAFRRWKDDPAVAPLLEQAFGAPVAKLWPEAAAQT